MAEYNSESTSIPEIMVTTSSPKTLRRHNSSIPHTTHTHKENPMRQRHSTPSMVQHVPVELESSFDKNLVTSIKTEPFRSEGYQKNGGMQYLKPSGLFFDSSTSADEETPLLSRKSSFGYREKRFDDDVQPLNEEPEVPQKGMICRYANYIKIAILSTVIVISVILYAAVQEHQVSFHQFSISSDSDVEVSLSAHKKHPNIRLSIYGPFLQPSQDALEEYDTFHVDLQLVLCNGTRLNIMEQKMSIVGEEMLDNFPESKINFVLDLEVEKHKKTCEAGIVFSTDKKESFPFAVRVSDLRAQAKNGVAYAAGVLVGLYLLIIFEIVHRTKAAMIAATVSIAILSQMNDKPSLEEIMLWIDIETLCLLFGMMVLVAILCETGFFDYAAVVAFKLAKGNVWTLVTILCLTTAVISAFLDNVTTILLFTPVTIRLCEVMRLNPKQVLITLIVFSNVGGTATAVGDPPNVIIVSNSEIQKAGIEFANFTVHMGLGIVFVMIATYVLIFIFYRTCFSLQLEDQADAAEIKQEIQVWKRTARSLSLYSRDESSVRRMLNHKVDALENMLKKRLFNQKPNEEDYQATLQELQGNYKIRDWPLLIKTSIVLFCVIIMFFIHSIPGINISLGWIALMGAIVLLVLGDLNDMEQVLAWVEWSTLVFFAALFVVMEALTKMGLLDYIGDLTEDLIMSLSEEARLPVSLIFVLWVSAIASSFIDNIPFTTVMLKIVLKIGKNPDLGLPLHPLVWALAFGACLGGNGTLIGASANVVCAGVAEQHGYRFTFMDFFKIGFPTMLVTTTVAMFYLLICHVAIGWNE